MKLDPQKVQALQDLPTPHTQKELQSFLGLINYLRPFLPDIAHKAHISQRTSQQLGLDTLNRCIISLTKTVDLQHPTQDHLSIL